MRKLLPFILLSVLLLCSCGGSEETSSSDEGILTITTSCFPGYDAARAVAGDLADISLLVPTGGDNHDWEPSIDDVIRIQSSDLFIYTGGESDTWLDNLLSDLDGEVEVFSLVENAPDVSYVDEDSVLQGEGRDHGPELDEHVWTAPSNEIAIVSALAEKLSSTDPGNAETYRANAGAYISEIERVRDAFGEIVASAERKELVVADRFPLLYFAREYGLSWTAAYPGCSSHTEPNSRTVAALIDKVRNENIPVVLHMELSSPALAETVASETGAKTLEFHSSHNVSKLDFGSGETWVSLMERNIPVLEEALN